MRNRNDKYDVSVIVPTYNRSKLLSYTLDSLIKQNYSKSRFEVIIGDDGSSDDTVELLKAYNKQLSLKYVFQEDMGYRPASARNKAVQIAEGKICLFIDAGIILGERCVKEHYNFHVQKTSRKAAIGYVLGFDHEEKYEESLLKLIVPAEPEISIKRLSADKAYSDIREPHYQKYQDKIHNLPAAWFYFWTCHVSVDVRDLKTVGLFDENYDGRWGMEDQDLGFRLQDDGVAICLLRDALSIHYPHGKDKLNRHLEGQRNCEYFNNKFKTCESEIYLKNYLSPTLVDINEISLKKGKHKRVLLKD
jgi:glycosyltransferase involved in cell wall biosynthesis